MLFSLEAILVADANPERRERLVAALLSEGFLADVVRAELDALDCFDVLRHQLVMIGDGGSGMAACASLRARSDVPIIVVTSGNDEAEVIAAFDSGADDCVTGTVRSRELVARVRAALRRSRSPVGAGWGRRNAGGDSLDPDVTEIGDVRLDAAGFEVTVRGRRVEFPLKEFEVLALLMANAGRTLTRRVLINRVWGTEPASGSKTLDAHVRRVRTKIEDDPSAPTRIVTIRGLGYRYNK
ncbi:MAG: response regulator transcription factor [Acidimicrobiia bacterium]